MKTTIFTSLILLMALLAGCKKYQYGPYFSLMSKKERIHGSWKVDSAITRFGDDIGATFSSYTFSFFKDGQAELMYQVPGGQPDTLYGEWSLEEEKDIFQWEGLQGDTVGFYYARNEWFDILRLTNEEFRLADKANTYLHLSPR